LPISSGHSPEVKGADLEEALGVSAAGRGDFTRDVLYGMQLP
jgi:hypothetical protein